MLDTGKDAIDVSATVTAKVGETAIEKGAQGLGGFLKLLLKLLQAVLQKAADKIANRKGQRKIETLMRDGDSTSFLELPVELDQKLFKKQMHKQGKKLAFQFSLTKSGDRRILTYKDKDAQVVALAYQNLQRDAVKNGQAMPDIKHSAITKEKEQQKNVVNETSKPQHEPIKVERDKDGNFVYSRGDVSMTSKNEKSNVVRQRVQDTFGIDEKGAWAVWNQGLDLSKNSKVANRNSIQDNISKAQEKQQADMKASKQAPKVHSTQKAAPAVGMAR